MNQRDLYQMLEFPEKVTERLNEYERERNFVISTLLLNRILQRNSWGDGIEELKILLGDDEDGIKILWELLNIISNYTYNKYVEAQISEKIFVDTMKFSTRFLNEYYQTYGIYRFVWARWYPRQISLNEFRIGALEFEFVNFETKEVAVHIPSDANLKRDSVIESIKSFFSFRDAYFPQWKEITMTCSSWLLSPVLKELLNETSNILAFQNMFEVDMTELDSTKFMQWVFPGYENIDENLPEKTTLQRNMKAYLLNGKKVGVAKGHLNLKLL